MAAIDSHVYLAGASGGVYALLAGQIAELLLNFSEMEFAWIRAAALTVLVGSDFSIAIYQRYFVDDAEKVLKRFRQMAYC